MLKHSVAALFLGAALHTAATGADFISTWSGTASFWSDATNWSTNPTVPNNGGSTFDAVQNGGTIFMGRSLITIQKLTMGGGRNIGAGLTLTLNELLTFSGGIFEDTGNVDANGGATFNGGSTMTITGGRNLNLGGNSTWSAGTIDISSGSAITNQAGRTFSSSSYGIMSNTTGGGTFNNQGIFTKSGFSTTTTISPVFNNTGTVNVTQGALALNGGGTHTNGVFNVSSGAWLNFTGGTHTLNGTASVAGSGTGIVRFSAGTVNFDAGTYHVARLTEISAGTANFNAAAFTNLLSLTGSATLGGTGTITASGMTTFNGGTMTGAGTTQANGGVTFISGLDKTISGGRKLNLGGNSTWSAGAIAIHSGAITNQAGRTFDNSFDGTMGGLVTGTFNNVGIFTKSAGAGLTNISPIFDNTGTVNANSGTLNLQGGVTQHSGTTLAAGTWNVTNGAAIHITTGSNIIINLATVMLDGAGSSFNRLTDALNNNQGSLTIRNNRDLTTAGAYANSGTTRVQDATTALTIGTGASAAYTQTAGVTTLVGGATLNASAFNLNGGLLEGTGTITLGLNGDLVAQSGAQISPGNSVGTLALVLSSGGDFIVTPAIAAAASGALLFELGTISDLITVAGGPMHIGAGLMEFEDFAFAALGGFGAGNYTLFDGDTLINGTLGTNLTGMIAGYNASLAFADDGRDLVLAVSAVPEPGTALAGVVLLGAGLCGRRRRR